MRSFLRHDNEFLCVTQKENEDKLSTYRMATNGKKVNPLITRMNTY
jgi:hypothetical protein